MSVLQSAARKGSTLTGHYSASRELSPEEVADKVAGDLEMQNTETRGRSRAISYVFNEDNSQTFSGIMSNSWFYAANKYAVAILISILKRASFYAKAVPVIILLLAVGGQAKSSTVILRLTTYEWAIFLTHIICINAVAAICEIVLFISLEIVLSTNYDAVYRCRALEGPLSYLATVAIMVNFFDYVALPDLGFAWGRVVTTIVAIIIFYAWKSFQLRKYYLSILKTRLEPKLELLAKKKRILSILASTVFLSHNHPMPRPEPPAPVVRTESFETDAAGNSGVFSNLNYVFHQIVNEAYNEGEKSSSEEEPQEVPTTGFWVSLNSKHRTLLLQGVMAVFTISGEVFIRDKASALKLGKQLYTHLSKNGHHHLTSNLICNAIRSSPFDWPNNLPNTVEGTIATALELFNCTQDSDDIILTEHDITSAVKNVYRSMKYAAGSFSDLQELNQSVLIIVDVLFWIVMFLVAQIILQLDATTVLAPVLTILFGASFAFANMLSNLLTAVAFVLFICPYDVGHRVILGFGSGQLAKGNILTVNLFYTTMITVLNEKVTDE